MMWSDTHDRQVFVFWRGVLIYKKWIDDGCSKVFHPYGLPSDLKEAECPTIST